MKKKIISILIILLPIFLVAQNNKFDEWKNPKYNAAKLTGSDYLTQLENDVIYYTNLARMNPKLFGETYLKSYLDSSKQNDSYTTSLIAELKTKKPMSPFFPTKDLYDEAYKHAVDMGNSGKIGHNTSSGESFMSRIKNLRKEYMSLAENCDYNFNTALDIAIGLMIDEGVPDHGHRANMFDPKLTFIGVSFQPHKKYGNNCVLDFGGKE